MRFALHDGPGIRTTVFFKGCPLDCWWCHNPESQVSQPRPMYFEERCRHCGECAEICPEQAITGASGIPQTDLARCSRCGTCVENCASEAREICGRKMGVQEVLAEIERDVVFFDDSRGGVTLSGGEPAAQPLFAISLLRACRERRIHTTIETCGFAPLPLFQTIAENAELVLFDLKMLAPERHRRYTGVHNRWILRNLEYLAAAGRPLVVRIPVIPGINDSAADAVAFADFLSAIRAPEVHLLPYHRNGARKYRRLDSPERYTGEPPSSDAMERFAQPLREARLKVKIGG